MQNICACQILPAPVGGKKDGLCKAAVELMTSPKSWPALFIWARWSFAVETRALLVPTWAIASTTLCSRERMSNATGQVVPLRFYFNVFLRSPHEVHRLVSALPSVWIFGLSGLIEQTCMHTILNSLVTHISSHLELLAGLALNQWNLLCAKCLACECEPLLDQGWVVKQSRMDV